MLVDTLQVDGFNDVQQIKLHVLLLVDVWVDVTEDAFLETTKLTFLTRDSL